MITEEKTFAFLIDCPSKGKFMMFPGFAEDMEDELKLYDEIDFRVENITWSAELAKMNYRTYKRKKK